MNTYRALSDVLQKIKISVFDHLSIQNIQNTIVNLKSYSKSTYCNITRSLYAREKIIIFFFRNQLQFSLYKTKSYTIVGYKLWLKNENKVKSKRFTQLSVVRCTSIAIIIIGQQVF